MLDVRGVCKGFRQGQKTIGVLEGLSLKLERGESLAIVGSSGSGKSTLLSLLAGLEPPDSGNIFFEGRDIAAMGEEEKTLLRSQKISIVFQQFHLLSHLTAHENVALKLEIAGVKDADKRAGEALEEVGLAERKKHFPIEMSGGEKQRVAIARAMVSRPQLLLADEPSGSLDERAGKHVVELFFKLLEKSGTSLVLVTHNRTLANVCGRLLHLEQGSLRE